MELVLMVGNIGSGKSTMVKDMVKDGDYVCVSLDSIRYGLGCGKYRFDRDLEPIVFKTGWFMLTEFMHWGNAIVVDETNMNRKYRKKFIKLAKDEGYSIKAIIMPKLTMEESVKRRMNDNHGDATQETWEMVWKKFNARYQAPSLAEGFDHVEDYKEIAK